MAGAQVNMPALGNALGATLYGLPCFDSEKVHSKIGRSSLLRATAAPHSHFFPADG
jgi:hypothetical protein